MAKSIISIEREDLPLDTEKKIKSNLRKINNALEALRDMGYNMYLSPNSLNVCDGDTHRSDRGATADQSVVVASCFVRGIDAGDW